MPSWSIGCLDKDSQQKHTHLKPFSLKQEYISSWPNNYRLIQIENLLFPRINFSRESLYWIDDLMAYPLTQVKKENEVNMILDGPSLKNKKEYLWVGFYVHHYYWYYGYAFLFFKCLLCITLILEIKDKIRSNAHVRKNVTRLRLLLFRISFAMRSMNLSF